ncbi:hypothetical protein JCM19233_2216 [Vibrio astriarenae]|nr:hypothetical protein JCM19233_2216 [Vibrio sp. C7]
MASQMTEHEIRARIVQLYATTTSVVQCETPKLLIDSD